MTENTPMLSKEIRVNLALRGSVSHRFRRSNAGLEVMVQARANGRMDCRQLQGNSQRKQVAQRHLPHQHRLERQRHSALEAAVGHHGVPLHRHPLQRDLRI